MINSTHRAQQVTIIIKCDRIHTWQTDMLLTLSICISWAGTVAWVYILHYPHWHHLDDNIVRWLKHHLHKTGSVTPTAHVHAGWPQTPAYEDVIIANVERKSWRSSHDITCELRLSQLKIMTINWNHTTACDSKSILRRPSSTDAILWMAMTLT